MSLNPNLTASAQSKLPVDTARTYKKQIGLTASPQLSKLFTANRVLPLGLYYKYQLAPNTALRFRLIGIFSQADTSNFKDDIFGFTQGYVTGPDISRWKMQGFMGYKWKRPLTQSVGVLYGTEAGLGYERERIAFSLRYPYPPGGLVNDNDERVRSNWQVQLRPFLGLYYQPTARLWLFAESAFVVSYTRLRWERHVCEAFTNGEPERLLDERAHANRVTAGWQPIQLLGANYSF